MICIFDIFFDKNKNAIMTGEQNKFKEDNDVFINIDEQCLERGQGIIGKISEDILE